MRKLLTLLNTVAIVTLLAGCGETGKETDPETAPEINLPETIVSSGISIESAGQSISVNFTTNVAWSATVSADWVSISPSSGEAGKNSVTVKVEENTSLQPRSATVTITDKGSTRKVSITVRQEALKASLSVSPESLTFSASKGEGMLQITSNTDWVVTKDAEWITLDSDKGKGMVIIAAGVTENPSLIARTGTITVSTSDGSVKKEVSVKQAGADVVFSIDESEFNVAAQGESFTVKVKHNIGYKIDSKPEWVKQTDKATSGNTDTYTFKAEANTSTTAREGVIVFCNDNNECVPVTVKQAAANSTLSISPTSITFTAKPESKTFTITSNTAWTVTSDASWVKLNKANGSNDAQITVSAEENTAATQRTALITIKSTDGKVTAVIKVTQDPADIVFSIDRNEFSIDAEGKEITIKVKHNTAYSVKSMPEWVKQTEITVSGDTDTISLAVQYNPGYKRQGEIVFNGDGIYGTVMIKQFGSKADGGNDDTTTGGKITLE